MDYFWVYFLILFLSSLLNVITQVIISKGAFKQFVNLHNDMITSLVKAPLRLYCTVLKKEILLNRVQSDLNYLETFAFSGVSESYVGTFDFFGTIFLSLYYMPISLIFFPLIFFGLFTIIYFWGPVTREQNQINSITKSSVIGVLNESIEGAETVKVYDIYNYQLDKLCYTLDLNYSSHICLFGSTQFFSIITDLFSWSFYLLLFIYFGFYKQSFEALKIGLLILNADKLAKSFKSIIDFIRKIHFFSINFERCLELTHLTPEDESGLTPDNWPIKGKVEFNNYSTKYPGGNDVLKNLTFSINASERIAIVGRSGSGKSTFCSSLLRILEASGGEIFLDDIDISKVNLRTLRRCISIIPHNPTLLKDTLRFNIDPLAIHSDLEILAVFEKIGLQEIIDLKGGLYMMVDF